MSLLWLHKCHRGCHRGRYGQDDEISSEKLLVIALKSNRLFNKYKDVEKIKAFLKDEISFDEVYPAIKSTKLEYTSPLKSNYIPVYGIDDFILRCVVVLGGSVGRYSHHLKEITGFSDNDIPSLINWFNSHDEDMAKALDICGGIIDNCYYPEDRIKLFADALSERTDDIAAADISKCSAVAKTLALKLFGNNESKYHKSIIALAGDTSKVIRDIVMDIVIRHPDWNDDIKVLLTSKKSSARGWKTAILRSLFSNK